MKYLSVIILFIAILLQSCSKIDDDLSDCGKDFKLDYELRLVTNMTTELHTQLGLETDVQLAADLKEHLKGIFTDYAHDVDLSFYDTQGDSIRLQHDQHIMDANQRSYVLNLPMREYMHLAVANVVDNPVVGLTNDERCHPSRLATTAGNVIGGYAGDTIASHTTGLFTARLPMDVKEGVDQTFNVRLYMANCAVALVVDDADAYGIRDIKVFSTGFATGFNIADSAFIYNEKTPIIRTTDVATTDTGTRCFCSVNFPSKDVRFEDETPAAGMTRTVIEAEEFFVAPTSDKSLFELIAYVTMADGSITKTNLFIRRPLRAGQLMIIRSRTRSDGGLDVKDHHDTVGVSVQIDWGKGGHFDPIL